MDEQLRYNVNWLCGEHHRIADILESLKTSGILRAAEAPPAPLACFYAYTGDDVHALAAARNMQIGINSFRERLRVVVKHGDYDERAMSTLRSLYDEYLDEFHWCGLD